MAIIISSNIVSLVVLPLFIATTMNNSHHNNNNKYKQLHLYNSKNHKKKSNYKFMKAH